MTEIIKAAAALKASIFEDQGKFYIRHFKDEEAGGGWEAHFLASTLEELLQITAEAERRAALTWLPAIIKCGWRSTYYEIGVAALETGEVRRASSPYESCFLLGTEEEMEIGLALLNQNQNLDADEVLAGIEEEIEARAAAVALAEKEAAMAPFVGCDWGYFYMSEASVLASDKKVIGRFTAEQMIASLDSEDLARWAQNPAGYFINGWNDAVYGYLLPQIEAAISKIIFGK